MQNLPTEMLLQIMEHCRIPELAKLDSTCSRLQKITRKYYGEKTYSIRFSMEETPIGQTASGELMLQDVLRAELHSAFPLKKQQITCKNKTEQDINTFIKGVFNQVGCGTELVFSKIDITADLLEAIQEANFNFSSVTTLQLLDCPFHLDINILLSFISRMRLHEFYYSNDDSFIDMHDLVYRNLSCNFSVNSHRWGARCVSLTDATLEALKQRPHRYFLVEGVQTSFTLAKIVELIEFAVTAYFVFKWNFGIVERGFEDSVILEKLRELPLECYSEDDKYRRCTDHVITCRNSLFKFSTLW